MFLSADGTYNCRPVHPRIAMDPFNLCVQAGFNVNLTARYDGGQNPIYELQVAPGLDLDGVKELAKIAEATELNVRIGNDGWTTLYG
jgi:hypothetical protein